MALNPVVADVTARIVERSRATRADYIRRMDAARDSGAGRAKLSCANWAHAFAGQSVGDKLTAMTGAQPNLGIVTAYNDMLSAHQPFERFPAVVREAVRAVGATAQVAGGTPAMCDGVTQGRPGMELSLFSRDVIAMSTGVALPSVILIMLFGQTRIFFVMARDGLLPGFLATIHPKWKTPHIVTMITGVAVALFAAFLPVGQLADISNSGTLFAFFMVAIAVLILRRTQPDRHRPFRTPLVWVVAPLAIIGTVGLYLNLPTEAKLVLPVWGAIGLVVYFLYGYRKSHVGRGLIEVHEEDSDAPPPPLPPIG